MRHSAIRRAPVRQCTRTGSSTVQNILFLRRGSSHHECRACAVAGPDHPMAPPTGQGARTRAVLSRRLPVGQSVRRATARVGCRKPLRSFRNRRRSIARSARASRRRLIDFDRDFSAAFSARPADDDSGEADPERFQRYFCQQGRFTAGVAVRYAPSMIITGWMRCAARIAMSPTRRRWSCGSRGGLRRTASAVPAR